MSAARSHPEDFDFDRAWEQLSWHPAKATEPAEGEPEKKDGDAALEHRRLGSLPADSPSSGMLRQSPAKPKSRQKSKVKLEQCLSWRSDVENNESYRSHPNKENQKLLRSSSGFSKSALQDKVGVYKLGSTNISSNSPKYKGLDPGKFHRKKRVSSSKLETKILLREEQQHQELKDTIEGRLLVQEKERHRIYLEQIRKEFRQQTTLKAWPLQDLAMEHLDYLLEGKHSMTQFHGGDCPSSESSSSTGSAAENVRRRFSKSPRSSKIASSASPHSDKGSTSVGCNQLKDCNGDEPLWSREPRIFATEKAQGKRKYLVGHFGRVADWYWRKCVNKHLYEVIRERTPCRMYFDLEYSKLYNKNVDSKALLEEFQLELAADLQKHLNVILDANNIIDLDSSSEAKFSRHWIIDLDDQGLFEDAPTVGRFIKRLVGRLAEELATDQLGASRPTLAKHLFVKTKDANKTSCFIDLGVYTRNRLFRCFGSSKFGKPNTLQVSDSNQYPLQPLAIFSSSANNRTKDENVEGASDQVDEISSQKSTYTIEEYIAANDWKPNARVLASTLVVPLGGAEGKRIFKVKDESTTSFGGGRNLSSQQRVFQSTIPIRTAKTPLPSLDKYVLEILGCRGGVQGAIRAWSMEYGGQRGDVPISITYQLCRNRFCELIGRAHKSNNIFWTILFDSWTCIQGCHDPECFGRGSPIAVLPDRLPTIRREYEEWQDEEFEKALLSLNIDDLTCSSDAEEEIGAASDESQAIKGSIEKPIEMDPNESTHETPPNTRILNASERRANDADNSTEFIVSDEDLLAAIEAHPELFP